MKKHWLAWLLAFCLMASPLAGLVPEANAAGVSVWDGTAATEFAGGKGTQEKPYLIETAQQLAYLAQSVNSGTSYGGEYISLQADLDLSRLPWTPIGTEKKYFSGTFLGNAHTISNLYVNAPSANNQGLFGYCNSSKISNLRLTDISVTGNTDVGGVTGYLYYGTIQDCNVSGSISGAEFVGGIVGYDYYGSIYRCINNASVLANQNYAGGIVGYGYFSSYISLCVNNGAVDSYGDYVGGISGLYGTISDCINTGAIGGNATGAVAGIGCGGSNTNCANMGTVTSKGSAYGIGGSATNCYNVGMVSTTDKSADVYSVTKTKKNCYTLRAVAEELDESDGNGLTILDEMNTPAFAATLNRNIDTQKYSTWLQDANVYGGLPYFEPRKVSKIAVTTPPTKSLYAPGDTFDPSGMTVTASCTDGSSYELSHNALTFFPNTPMAEGTSSVTVFYGSMSTTCAVTVLPEHAQNSPEYDIESLTVKTTSGVALSAIPNGQFLATIAVKRSVPGDNTMVVLASYTTAGQFRGLLYVQVEEPVGATTYLTLPIDNASGSIGQLKAFVIHSLDDPRPLGDPVSFPAA
ncbi:MAG: bacterial Ig-like domain-containing protein [Oscillibacter sp.]|nr:bacterial Ig-like domain-containing protein [Oscillibacter sp.]